MLVILQGRGDTQTCLPSQFEIAIVFCPWVPNTVCFYSLTMSSQVLYWWYLGSAFGWQGHFYLLLANIVKKRLLVGGSFIT
jgi:hypothetical protein